MKKLKTWRDVIKAILDGEDVQCMYGDQYMDRVDVPDIFISMLDDKPIREHRIKPKTIMIGDIEIPEPIQSISELVKGDRYYCPHISSESLFEEWSFSDDFMDHRVIGRGVAYKTKEAAIQHAKALIALTNGE